MKYLKAVRTIIIVVFSALVLIDLYLVFSEDYPTFSKVFHVYRKGLVWMSFVFGGLIFKIFFNRPANSWKSELYGFGVFLACAILIFFLARFIEFTPTNLLEFSLMAVGGILARIFWPQYKLPTA